MTVKNSQKETKYNVFIINVNIQHYAMIVINKENNISYQRKLFENCAKIEEKSDHG